MLAASCRSIPVKLAIFKVLVSIEPEPSTHNPSPSQEEINALNRTNANALKAENFMMIGFLDFYQMVS